MASEAVFLLDAKVKGKCIFTVAAISIAFVLVVTMLDAGKISLYSLFFKKSVDFY